VTAAPQPRSENTVVIKVENAECGLEEAAELRQRCLDAVTSTNAPVLILDLSDVRLLDSTCIGVIIGARKRLTADDRELRLAALQDSVMRTIRMMGLHKMLAIYPSVEAALP
jgi:anti-anti-sigma factor